jgi:hypothetical protein
MSSSPHRLDPRLDLVRRFPFTATQINREAEEAIHNIRRSAILQLIGMAEWATDPACRDCLHSIVACVQERFMIISELANSDQMRPFNQIVLAEGDGPVSIE